MTPSADQVLAAIDGPYAASNGNGRGSRVKLTAAREISSERVRWLWSPRLPLRSLTVVAGEKGLGKSLLTNAWLVAEASRSRLPGELDGRPLDVLVCSAEDDWRSVVKPRLIVHGADLDRCTAFLSPMPAPSRCSRCPITFPCLRLRSSGCGFRNTRLGCS